MNRKHPPSRLWYFVIPLLPVAVIAVFGTFLFWHVKAIEDPWFRIVAPKALELSLSEPGRYTIFLENVSSVDGKVYVSQSISGLKITVTSVETGQPVALEANTGMSYSYSSHSGISIYDFDIETPGRYRFEAAYENGASEPEVVLAVGRGFFQWLFITIVAGLGLAFGGIASLAGAVFLLVFVRQKRKVALEGRPIAG
jgi:hypothetical protein